MNVLWKSATFFLPSHYRLRFFPRKPRAKAKQRVDQVFVQAVPG
jgi:hypothetical protein